MFDIESRWVGDRLAAYPAPLISPLLNVGSSTSEFREAAQPWTVRNIFTPLAARGVEIVHLDARAGAGIDIRADLMNAADFARIGSRRFRAYEGERLARRDRREPQGRPGAAPDPVQRPDDRAEHRQVG